jgi:cytochrome b
MKGKVISSVRAVEVWDLPVRLFHWALVLLVISQIVTVSIGGNAMEYHMLGGYAILTLVLFRIAWGLFGSRHARFANFVRGPTAVFAYARELFGTQHRQHLGHNPLGAWSVVLMVLSLGTQAVSGLFADDEVMTTGPLEKHVSDDVASLMTEIHEVNAFVLGLLIAVHVAAIFYYLIARRENLIRPMITGTKDWPEPAVAEASSTALLFRAALILVLSGLTVAAVVNL